MVGLGPPVAFDTRTPPLNIGKKSAAAAVDSVEPASAANHNAQRLHFYSPIEM